MMADHYAVLGLAPYAEHSAVRAAYLALMRRYHPDMNSSAEAAARAREVTAAYEVLGNPDSRSDYDLARAQAHAHAEFAGRRSRGLGWRGAVAALASVGGIALLVFVLPSGSGERPAPPAALTPPPAPRQPAQRAQAPPSPAKMEPATPAAPLPAPAPVETARAAPVAAAPAPAPVEVRRSPQPPIPAPAPPRIEPQRPLARTAKASTAKASTGKARPSTSEPALAGLDRHLGMLFRQSMQRSDPARRQSLYRDHYRFIARLNACSTEACKQREYLGRMGEVGRTMAAPAKPRAANDLTRQPPPQR